MDNSKKIILVLNNISYKNIFRKLVIQLQSQMHCGDRLQCKKLKADLREFLNDICHPYCIATVKSVRK